MDSKFIINFLLNAAKSVYGPLDKQKIFTDCSDAMHRGGIVPNPGQPVSILIKVYLQNMIFL